MTPVEITMKSSRCIQNLLKLRIIPVKYVYYFFIIASCLYLPSLLHTSAFLTEKQKFASTRRKKKTKKTKCITDYESNSDLTLFESYEAVTGKKFWLVRQFSSLIFSFSFIRSWNKKRKMLKFAIIGQWQC